MNIKIIQDIESTSYKKETTKRGYKGELIQEISTISNFLINPLYTVICENIVYYHSEILILKNKKLISKKIVFSSSDFITVKSFKKRLSENDYGVFFIGTDNDLSIINKFVSEKSPKKMTGLNYIGLIKNNNSWEYVDKTTNNNLFIVSENVFLNHSFNDEYPSLQEMKLLAKNLFNFNSEEIVFPVLCSISTCFLHARLKDLGIKTPVTNFSGEAGSAKSSTLENIVSPFFGDIIADSASKLKEFASLRIESESNIFPHFIEEYKEHNMTKYRIDLISSIVRSIYDGHSIKRGQSDQTINEYILRSPLFIVGETGFDETAVKERLLAILFSKKTLTIENKFSFFELKRNKEILSKLGKLFLDITLNLNDNEIIDRYNYFENLLINEDIPERIKNNIIVSCLSYGLFISSFEKYNLKIKKNIVDIIVYSQKNFNLAFKKNTKTILENTLEIISSMIEQKKLISGEDYFIKDNMCIIKTMQVYHKLTKYIGEHRILDEVYGKKSDFINQIRYTDFFIEKETDKIYGKSVRGLFLDLTKMIHLDFCLSNNLDSSAFIKSIPSEKEYIKTEKEAKQIDLNEFNFK